MTKRFSVKNSIDFIDRIKDVVIEEDDILVSFDVVSQRWKPFGSTGRLVCRSGRDSSTGLSNRLKSRSNSSF